MKSFAALLGSLLLLSMLGVAAYGQTAGTGAIAGTITDPNSAVVASASISAIDATTGEKRTVVSSNTGTYLVPLLPPATYRVEVSRSGFKLSVNADIPVHITETTTVNVKLEIGATRETVEVKANSELLKTEQSTLGNVVDQKEVSALPLVTRNYSQILGLSPGVSAETFSAGEIGRGGVDDSMVTGGSSYSDNNFQMNGVEVDDLQSSGHYSGGVATPNPDSIQEFKVQTSQYDSSYGRNAGANVDVLTKAGTNSLHGNVWEYFRNEALNANDFFRNGTGEPRAVLRQNQFGFTLGGPVKKDKLLFFTSYQGTRQQNGIDPQCSSSVILPVLTADRSAAGLAAAVGPDTAFGGYDILGRPVNAADVSSQAQKLFNAKLPNGQYVIPNPQTTITDQLTGLPEGFSTYSSACPYNEDQFITNLDWLQTPKSTFQGRFFFANSKATFTLPQSQTTGSTLPGAPLTNPQNFRNFSLSHTYLFSTHLVNQAQIGFHRTYSGTDQSFPLKYSDIGSTVPSFDDGRPEISVFGGLSMGGNGQTLILGQNTYVFQDTVSWIHGRHSFRFGGNLSRAQDNMSEFAFGGYAVFINYPGLLLGQPPFNPYITEDFSGLTARGWRVWDGSLYAQDDVKVTSRLTLNLGFRYERLGDVGEINGRNSSMDPALIDPNPPTVAEGGTLAGIVVANNFPGTIPSGVIRSGNDLAYKGAGQNTWSPRIGFAWSLPGTNRFVLRGGYGVYHQRTTGQMFLQQISNQPFGLIRVQNPDVTNGFDNPFPPDPGAFPQFSPYAAPDPTTGAPGTSLSPSITDPNLRPPTFQRYSLNLQSQLGRDFVLEVGYAGMRGTHMIVWHDINQANLASPENPIRGQTTNTNGPFGSNVAFRVPYEGLSASSFYDTESATGFAWYNALEATLSKRFSHGLQFLASYTFARDLANVWQSTGGANGGQVVGNNNDPRWDYGPDSFVRPHRFVFSGVYELPGPSNRHSLVGQALGSWKLAGVTTIQSGHRLPLLSLPPYNVYGIATDFAEIVPGCRIETSGSTVHRLNNWINQSCVTTPPIVGDDGWATGFGNSRMGILHGPDQVNTDISLIKLFPIHESMNVEFRSEFFNAFNHPNFQDPSLYQGTAGFGQVALMSGNPRIIQFALKVSF